MYGIAFLRYRLTAGAFIAALTSAAAVIAADADSSRPNIILCMSDDQGWGDVGYNGHPVLQTPHLDQMAAEGVRFDRFYSGAPVCSPTRGSCLTGRHPYRYGVIRAKQAVLWVQNQVSLCV